MKIVHLTQGTAEWHAHRARHFNASDAPAMMGCSPYKTRAQLLRELHTGLAGEVDAATQRIFDAGHRFEALARPLAEEVVGDDLYPCVGVDGRYSASFDGLTLAGDVAWEHKSLNADLRSRILSMEAGRDLPLHYRVQMEHQCMVSGAARVLFSATRWADDGELIEARHCWYYPDAELRAQIVAGWTQLERDLAAYVPPQAAEPVRAEPIESLPAVAVRLDGALTVAGNLPTFAQALRDFIARIPAKPATDTEFATTEAACKALKKAEEALDAAEAGALASITDVEQMRRAVAECRKLARDTRLAAEKLVERRKAEIKEQAVLAARRALDDHIAALQAELAPMRLQPVAADFAGAIKGLRSIASMQDALDTTLARAKIDADAQARLIRGNVAAFKAATGDSQALQALFADLHLLVHKAADDFTAVLDARIVKHRADEAAREAKRQAEEAVRISAAAQAAREQAEREAAAALASTAAPAKTIEPAAVSPSTDTRPLCMRPVDPLVSVTFGPTQAQADALNQPATLTLGMICERLQFVVRADFVADVLHVSPAKVDGKRPGTYTESQFQTICRQLQSHVSAMAELYGQQREAA